MSIKTRRLITLGVSGIIGATMIIVALLYTPAGADNQSISLDDLAMHNGLNGTICWVAVDGTVYAISGFSEWQMGKHLPANDNNVVCGRDLSEYIGKSPHGKSVLQLLRQVGKLQKTNW